MKNSYKFYRNSECEYFPCHKVADTQKFNCLFCYCPLYHMAYCGGDFSMLPNGIKDCTDCIFPHLKVVLDEIFFGYLRELKT